MESSFNRLSVSPSCLVVLTVYISLLNMFIRKKFVAHFAVVFAKSSLLEMAAIEMLRPFASS